MSSNLPPFEEAAKEAVRKAKEAGAGKYEPGSPSSNAAHQEAAVHTSPYSGASASGPVTQEKGTPMPPVVRSVLAFSANSTQVTSWMIKGAPALAGGLLYQGRPFCYAGGYRDTARGMDNDDKGNHLKLRDPMGVHELSVPVMGVMAWKLHNEKKLNLFTPITHYVKELPEMYELFTLRDIFSFRANIQDKAIFASVGASTPNPYAIKASTQYYDRVWKPVGDAFTGKTPSDCRTSLLKHMVDKVGKLPPVRHHRSARGGVSHCALALAAIAMERVMETSFEEMMQNTVFNSIEATTAGYGVPAQVNRSYVFYQPTGLPSGHYDYYKPVPPGDVRNAAPPVFNQSLNLFANAEDAGKLAILALEASVNATKEFERPNAIGIQPYYELGLLYDPKKKSYTSIADYVKLSGVTPFAFTLTYDLETDAGAFAVINCGSRRARLIARLAATSTTLTFQRQCLDAGMDIFNEGKDFEAPQGDKVNLADAGIQEEMQKQEKTDKLWNKFGTKKTWGKGFGGAERHTRL